MLRNVLLVGLLLLQPVWAAPEVVPGINVHAVVEKNHHVFWRGAAPRQDTMEALSERAASHDATLTVFDLRHPASADDQTAKDGRLSPAAEEQLAHQLHVQYVSISALDKGLPQRIEQALRSGDVYMHCMYGVNRTGFATGRYEVVTGRPLDHAGLGAKDITQGIDFQRRLIKP